MLEKVEERGSMTVGRMAGEADPERVVTLTTWSKHRPYAQLGVKTNGTTLQIFSRAPDIAGGNLYTSPGQAASRLPLRRREASRRLHRTADGEWRKLPQEGQLAPSPWGHMTGRNEGLTWCRRKISLLGPSAEKILQNTFPLLFIPPFLLLFFYSPHTSPKHTFTMGFTDLASEAGLTRMFTFSLSFLSFPFPICSQQ